MTQPARPVEGTEDIREAMAAELARMGLMPDTHLAYNPYSERYETGGDEIEFADESD